METTPPAFTHDIIHKLYENDLKIDHAILREILALPRESLVEDLKKVIRDSEVRYKYFEQLDVVPEEQAFPTHAFFLLTELGAKEALPFLLEHLRQPYEVLDFWYFDHLTETFYQLLHRLAGDQLDTLMAFASEPHDASIRTIPFATLTSLILAYPEKREQYLAYFDTAMAKLLAKKDQPGPGDDEFGGFLVNYLTDVKAADRLPQIKALFEADLVDPSIPGDYKEVAREMQWGSRYTFGYEVYPSIFEHYDHIVQTWAGYKEDFRAILKTPSPVKTKDDIEITRPEYQPITFREPAPPQEPVKRTEPKVGRNDPCPCGSGKKYKKCCMP